MNAPGTATVYRCFDSRERLLYVGQTVNLPRRLAQHQSDYWWAFVTRVESEPCADRDAAKARETEAIQTEHPMYNVHGRAPRYTWPREAYDAYIEGLRAFPHIRPNSLRLAEREYALRFPAVTA